MSDFIKKMAEIRKEEKELFELANEAVERMVCYKKALNTIIISSPGSAHRIAMQAIGKYDESN